VAIDPEELRRRFEQRRNPRQEPQKPPPPAHKPRQREKDPELLPEAPEIEKAALGVILSNSDKGFATFERIARKGFFASPVHREIYDRAKKFHMENGRIDMIGFTAELGDAGQLEKLGGPSMITDLFTQTSPFEMLEYYIGQLRDKYVRRHVMMRNFALASNAKNGEVADLLADWSRGLEDLRIAAGGANGSVPFSHEELKAFVPAHDPNILLGNRWLCRGFTSLLAGPAGAGKSTLEMQMAIYWGCGMPFCGIRPARPLKSLILQAENDLGDSAEQYQGVLRGIVEGAKADFELDESLVARNVLVHWVVGKSGFEFCGILDEMIQIHQPDIVWIDPLFAFAGCDLLKPKETTEFIRQGLYPIAVKRNVALLVVHHIGKSYRDNTEKEKWTDLDFQYLGFGTSEIQNAFRAVTILLPVSNSEGSHEKLYRLILSKRGNRAGARDPEGHFTTNLYLSQASEGIFWMQSAKPEKENKGGRPKETSADDILEEMSLVTGWDTTELFEHMKKEHGMKERTFYRHWNQLKKTGKIQLDTESKWTKKT
jgi:AAA domain/DnaB-like helicase N terminal domain